MISRPISVRFIFLYRIMQISLNLRPANLFCLKGTRYNSYFVPNNLVDDEKFLRNDLVHQLLQTVEIGNSYPVEYMVEDAYFKVSEHSF